MSPDTAQPIRVGQSEGPSVEKISAEERQTLEREWNAGELKHHLAMVRAFVQEQRSAILELAADSRELHVIANATRRHIATLRTVHHASEMKAQMGEIHNEIWYCGERGDYDRKRIAREWVERHGETWRRWRIKEYLFVVERSAEELARLIHVS